MENKYPQRKKLRLNDFDYSQSGAYFVTICTKNKKCLFSHIVGRGFTPAEETEIKYTTYGEIAEKQLLSLENRYECVKIDKYVIMPNHIHAIIVLDNETAGASPCPTLSDIVCAYKSITTRECRKHGFDGNVFQTSFYDHIIRNQKDYDEIYKYIQDNPVKWEMDKLYVD